MPLHQRAMIANQKFIYKKEGDHLAGKLKYFQHRNDRNTHVRQHDDEGNPIRRWVDHGLGSSHSAIATSCAALATTGLTNDVGARTLVLSPQVEFMQAIAPDRRAAVMEELTEATVDRWFEAMNLPTAEYAFVVHQGEVKTDRPDEIEQEDREFVHSHVVLAATVPGLMEDRDNYKVYKEQLELLHQASADEMERIWTRELGAERVAELNQDLQDLTERLQAIDEERERAAIEQATPTPHEIDETMLEIYQATGIEPPEDLLERVYDAREAEVAQDPVAGLRALGFDIPDEEVDILRDLEALGFDIPRDPIQQDLDDDVVALARELGFDIPDDELVEQLQEEDFDLLQAYRDLGFIIPDDDMEVGRDDLEEIIEELRDLGFDIPDDLDVDTDMDDAPEIADDIEIEMD
ncbi:MAG: hypothetical protein AAFR81_19010 [Chloroflexota bacterium]